MGILSRTITHTVSAGSVASTSKAIPEFDLSGDEIFGCLLVVLLHLYIPLAPSTFISALILRVLHAQVLPRSVILGIFPGGFFVEAGQPVECWFSLERELCLVDVNSRSLFLYKVFVRRHRIDLQRKKR